MDNLEKTPEPTLESLGVTLERAQPRDAATLVEFEQKIAATDDLKRWTVPVSNVEEALKYINEYTFYFVRKENEVIGTAAYQIRQDGTLYVGSFALLPEHQMRDIAQALIKFIRDENPEARRVEIAVHPENLASLRLCRQFGFQRGEIKENYFGNGEPFQILFLEKSKID